MVANGAQYNECPAGQFMVITGKNNGDEAAMGFIIAVLLEAALWGVVCGAFALNARGRIAASSAPNAPPSSEIDLAALLA